MQRSKRREMHPAAGINFEKNTEDKLAFKGTSNLTYEFHHDDRDRR